MPIDVRDELGMAPLHWLAVEGHCSCVQWLVDEIGADVECPDLLYRQTPLHFAASKEHPRVAQQLLELRANPMATDKNGWTPLHTAARSGSAEAALLPPRQQGGPTWSVAKRRYRGPWACCPVLLRMLAGKPTTVAAGRPTSRETVARGELPTSSS